MMLISFSSFGAKGLKQRVLLPVVLIIPSSPMAYPRPSSTSRDALKMRL